MDDKLIDLTLKKVVKGAGLFLLGTVFSLLIGLTTKVIVVRYLSKPDYGVLTLALTIFGIVQAVASFGVPLAMVRQTSYYSGKGEEIRVKATMKLALYLIVILGITWALTLFYFSGVLAEIFKMPKLRWILKVISFCIPFALINSYLISVYQALENAKIKVIFNDFLPNFLKFLLIIAVIILGLSFYGIVLVYITTPVLVFLMFLFYFFSRGDFKRLSNCIPKFEHLKELLSFSAPLALQSILGMVMTRTDVLMIGYFLTSNDVAIYGAARPIANTLTVILGAANFLYLPLVSQLFGKKKIIEIKRTYAVITKWITAVTLPVFLIIFLFSRKVIWVLYGPRYLNSSLVLSILALTFFLHVAFGPNILTLIIFGENRFVTLTTTTAALTNIILNAIFLPRLGVVGAAVATLITYSVSNIACSMQLLIKYGIHPFTRNYIKPILICFTIATIISKCFNKVNLFDLILLFLLFLIVYVVVLVLTRSFDREDIMMLNMIEQKTGVNLSFVKNIFLKKFL